jgi:Ku protein
MAAIRNVVLQHGLIQAPVSVNKATEERGKVSLNQAHECKPGEFTRINKRNWCSTCQKEIDHADLKSVFPHGAGFLEITKQDKDSIKIPSTGAIIIEELCDPQLIYGNPTLLTGDVYFLTPPTAKGKNLPPTAYAVLLKSLQGKVAIARTAMYDREYTCAIRVVGSCFVMDLIRYPSEMRQVPEVPLPAVDPSYLQMMEQFNQRKTVAKPKLDYPDNYNEAFAKMIEAKAAGTPLAISAPVAAPPTVDMKAMLEAMLAQQPEPAVKAGPAEVNEEQPKKATRGKGKKVKAA